MFVTPFSQEQDVLRTKYNHATFLALFVLDAQVRPRESSLIVLSEPFKLPFESVAERAAKNISHLNDVGALTGALYSGARRCHLFQKAKRYAAGNDLFFVFHMLNFTWENGEYVRGKGISHLHFIASYCRSFALAGAGQTLADST